MLFLLILSWVALVVGLFFLLKKFLLNKEETPNGSVYSNLPYEKPLNYSDLAQKSCDAVTPEWENIKTREEEIREIYNPNAEENGGGSKGWNKAKKSAKKSPKKSAKKSPKKKAEKKK